jgi:trimeric autotransporter adhesin
MAMKKIFLSISVLLWVTHTFCQPWNANYGTASGVAGTYSSYFGYAAGMATNGMHNSYVGAYAGSTLSNGNKNSALGSHALHYNTGGSENTALGMNAMYSNNDGSGNTALGFNSLYSNKDGSLNTAIGTAALYSNIKSLYNVAVGPYSLYANNADKNTAIGFFAMNKNKTGFNNVATGYQALHNNDNGFENTAIGYQALHGTTFSVHNVAVGAFALHNPTGNFNVAVGVGAGNYSEPLSNIVAIGWGTKVTGPNQVRLGNSGTTSIGGYAPWSNLSDGRFKRDVKEDIVGLTFINQLRPVSYTMDRTAVDNFLGVPENARIPTTERKNKKERQIGFIAQEVEAIVKKQGIVFSGVETPQNEKDPYSIRYSEFVVPLVKAVQELSAKLEQQNIAHQEEIAELKQQLSKYEGREIGISGQTGSRLLQNTPNPFSTDTEIKMTLSESTRHASIVIYNLEGKQLKNLQVNERGDTSIKISGNELDAGMYLYTLIIDGKVADTKRLILTK